MPPPDLESGGGCLLGRKSSAFMIQQFRLLWIVQLRVFSCRIWDSFPEQGKGMGLSIKYLETGRAR